MRVLIVRLGAMGDVLHAMPAVAALRAAHPDAYIGWAIERRWTPLLVADEYPLSGCPTLTDFVRVRREESSGCPTVPPDFGTVRSEGSSGCPTLPPVVGGGCGSSSSGRSPQRPLIDHVHVVNTRAWRRSPFSDETWAELRNVFREIRAQRYDIAIDFQGAIKSAVVAQFSGAPMRIGFAQPREKPATMFYTSVVQPRARHIIDQNLSLLSPVCHPESGDLLFPSDPAAESTIDEVWDRVPSAGPTKRVALLNPGAGWPAKQWPTDRYAEVARALQEDGIFSLVNYGPGEESLAREVEAQSGDAARPIFCTLSELIALTRRASLFIGGDTGPMHLAAALGVPTVALFGPTDPARNGPYHVVSRSTAVPQVSSRHSAQSSIDNHQSSMSVTLRHPSSATDYSHRNAPDPGLLQITAAEVIAAARALLKSVAPPLRSVLPQGGDVPGEQS